MTVRAIVVTCVVALVVAIVFALARSTLVALSLFAAIVVGEGLRPLVNALIQRRVPRLAAITVTFLALLGGLLLAWVIPLRALIPQAHAFWRHLPQLIVPLIAALQQAVPVGGVVGPIAQSFLRVPAQIATLLSVFGLMLIMVVFWLDSAERLEEFILSLVPANRREPLVALFREISTNLSAYVIGVIVNGSMVGVESWAVLTLLHEPYAGILGLFQALVTTIPYLGPAVGVAAVAIVVFAGKGLTSAALAVVAVGIMHALQGAFVSPVIFKRAVNLDPLLTVVATAVGGALFGVLGVILAVPAASIVQTIVVRAVAPAIRNSFTASGAGGGT